MKQKIIAVIDSGVGGLNILSPLKKVMPYNDFLYYSDGANLPYGNKTQEELCFIAKKIVENILQRFQCDLFVLACNTLTAGGIDYLRQVFPTKIFVGCEPNLTFPQKDNKRKPLVLCTSFTKNSQRINARFGDSAFFLSAPCLADMIEKEESDEMIENYLKEILPYSLSCQFDCIVLGCTHYYFKKNLIEKIYSLPLYTSVDGVVKRVYEIAIEQNAISTYGNPIICFWETGDAGNNSAVLRFWKKM